MLSSYSSLSTRFSKNGLAKAVRSPVFQTSSMMRRFYKIQANQLRVGTVIEKTNSMYYTLVEFIHKTYSDGMN